MKRVPLYVPGIDKLLGGGIPEGALVLIRGPPGSGKTVFTLQSLYLSAKHGRTGLYFSFEERPETIKWYASVFGWNIGEVQKQKKLFIYYLPQKEYDRFKPESIDSFKERLDYIIKTSNAKIIVFDSVTEISLFLEKGSRVKPFLNAVNDLTKKHSCVTILTAHPQDPAKVILETTVDGVLDFIYAEDLSGTLQRTVRITKMRATRHPLEKFPLWIEKDGVIVEHFPTSPSQL